MDLLKIDTTPAANEGAVMEVRHPTTGEVLLDNGEAVTITLLGTDSDAFEKINDAAVNRRLKGTGRLVPLAEEQRVIAIEMLAGCTLAWKGIGVEDGKNLEFSRPNAKLVYTKFKWLRDQVDKFVGDRTNFTKQPSAG